MDIPLCVKILTGAKHDLLTCPIHATAVMYYKVSLEMDLLLQSQTQMDKKKRITALS